MVALVTQTLNDIVVEDATKEINELFSIEPQNAVYNSGQ
jgi:hydrogenase maturation factor